MAIKYFQGLGRRKTATAQVRLSVGTGKIVVNGKAFEDFFTTDELRIVVLRPLKAVNAVDKWDLSIKTSGGGMVGQSDASRLGVARALVLSEETLKSTLKAAGLMTRDPRKKERKKFGKRGARRSPQWRKR